MTEDRPPAAVRLEQARVVRGFAFAKDAATYFGWKYATYAQHESGERGIARAAARYAVAFGVSEGWLLTGEGKGPDPTADIIQLPQRQKLRGHTPVIIPGEQLVSPEKMPVYAGARGGERHIIVDYDPIDYVKRPAILENVRGGYGLLIMGGSMFPAFDEGDTALVHPHLPPASGTNVVLYTAPPNGGEVEAIVKRLERLTARDYHLRQWSPNEEFVESRQEWPIAHRIVGKYERR